MKSKIDINLEVVDFVLDACHIISQLVNDRVAQHQKVTIIDILSLQRGRPLPQCRSVLCMLIRKHVRWRATSNGENNHRVELVVGGFATTAERKIKMSQVARLLGRDHTVIGYWLNENRRAATDQGLIEEIFRQADERLRVQYGEQGQRG